MTGSQWTVSKCELLLPTWFPASQSALGVGEISHLSGNRFKGDTLLFIPKQLMNPPSLAPKGRKANSCAFPEAERPRAGEALEISECDPLIFHMRPREATRTAQGQRVNYSGTGAALEVSAFPMQGLFHSTSLSFYL